MSVKQIRQFIINLQQRIIMASPLLKKIADRIADAKNERASLRAEVEKLSKTVEEQRKAFDKANADDEADDTHIVELEDKVAELKAELDKTAAEEAEEDAQEAEILKSLEEDKPEAEQGAPATPQEAEQAAINVTSAPVKATTTPAPKEEAVEESEAEDEKAEDEVGAPEETVKSLDPFVQENARNEE